ncbi:hypothetical protein EXU85_24060 [Spirosoma sp. KCTC 42546]|uniref:hypothetical protein n=1 Tax=Spirosoma sp. KCTC 42546 TaxID=2520506 RepID=UPI00115A7D22|nr:hypothetical protein [Spirosoma sp. KCTC 42546]QDK81515.1 hypothetical protein EXU85_24060 [Spirosoma sp. KCTC 42546]
MARALKGQSLKPFSSSGLGQFASFWCWAGGIAEVYGFQLTGLVALLMRWFAFNYVMPSRKVMLRGVGDWFFLAFHGQ